MATASQHINFARTKIKCVYWQSHKLFAIHTITYAAALQNIVDCVPMTVPDEQVVRIRYHFVCIVRVCRSRKWKQWATQSAADCFFFFFLAPTNISFFLFLEDTLGWHLMDEWLLVVNQCWSHKPHTPTPNTASYDKVNMCRLAGPRGKYLNIEAFTRAEPNGMNSISAWWGCETNTHRDWSSPFTCHTLDYINECTSVGIAVLVHLGIFFCCRYHTWAHGYRWISVFYAGAVTLHRIRTFEAKIWFRSFKLMANKVENLLAMDLVVLFSARLLEFTVWMGDMSAVSLFLFR